MLIFKTIKEINDFISLKKRGQKSIGLVPTMGALHRGHLSLIQKAKEQNDVVVCSIFVNPIQFNNPEDLKKYPRTPQADQELLEKAGCNAIFSPDEKEMYPEPVTKVYEMGGLEKVMEGAFRPGHFNGVGVIVLKLFDIILPNKAYFGEKDFQQLTIIKYLTKIYSYPVTIVPCPIVRENNGLAMSSRNARLTAGEKSIAPLIYQTLVKAKGMYENNQEYYSADTVKKWVVENIEQNSPMKVEYFELSDIDTLQPVSNWTSDNGIIGCIAVYLGNVRLIDNIVFIHNFASCK
ncbi:MAG: pantoate--beta-alanine ligase [Lentimicrobiaceae bacterium]|nr:pantoate--beta-alanine ligase [Lentimicrobiaceae bacterium]